jgi:hypothetical protein
MSFDVFVECFGETKRIGLSKDSVRSLFPISREEPEFDLWVVEYDDLNVSFLYSSYLDRDPQRLTGFMANRPCGDLRFWDALFSILQLGSVFIIWPGGKLTLAFGAGIEGLTDEMLVDLGPPVYVRSGLEILECVQKT